MQRLFGGSAVRKRRNTPLFSESSVDWAGSVQDMKPNDGQISPDPDLPNPVTVTGSESQVYVHLAL